MNNPKIKAVITDVDGVMIGRTEGLNFPLPEDKVIQSLKTINQHGLPIILCTGKFYKAVEQIILGAELDHWHITDNGALIVNPIKNILQIKNLIDESVVKKFIAAVNSENIYSEIFGTKDYYVLNATDVEFSAKRVKLLQSKPTLGSWTDNIIKLQAFSENSAVKQTLENIASNLGESINYAWSYHPYHPDKGIMIITPTGISKKTAAIEVIGKLGVSFDEVLGIGDGASDWKFMSLCGFVGTIGDNNQLKQLCETKPPERRHFGGSVEDQGLLAIFRHFKLL